MQSKATAMDVATHSSFTIGSDALRKQRPEGGVYSFGKGQRVTSVPFILRFHFIEGLMLEINR